MNSSTNPRKFAEKIAKLHQKEMEQTMAFEQIMAEVIGATRVSIIMNIMSSKL
jgi:CREB-regulated transcription coactivator 1